MIPMWRIAVCIYLLLWLIKFSKDNYQQLLNLLSVIPNLIMSHSRWWSYNMLMKLGTPSICFLLFSKPLNSMNSAQIAPIWKLYPVSSFVLIFVPNIEFCILGTEELLTPMLSVVWWCKASQGGPRFIFCSLVNPYNILRLLLSRLNFAENINTIHSRATPKSS